MSIPKRPIYGDTDKQDGTYQSNQKEVEGVQGIYQLAAEGTKPEHIAQILEMRKKLIDPLSLNVIHTIHEDTNGK